MRTYGVIFERTRTGFSAHVPDLPGCIAAGRTRSETLRLIRGAIRLHIRGMEKDGEAIPESSMSCAMVEV